MAEETEHIGTAGITRFFGEEPHKLNSRSVYIIFITGFYLQFKMHFCTNVGHQMYVCIKCVHLISSSLLGQSSN